MELTVVPLLIWMIGLVIVFVLGWLTNSWVSRGRLTSAETLARRIKMDAESEAEALKKAALLEAKDECFKEKLHLEQEIDEKQAELRSLEAKLFDREKKLDKKVDILNTKERNLQFRERQISLRERTVRMKDEQLTAIIKEQNSRLERISGMSEEEAKMLLLLNLEEKVKQQAARRAKEIRDEMMKRVEEEAKAILSTAIQRFAADHTLETTVSVVTLPSDEMKGRIIGREGRNIRAFETATGIDVIVDDTPEAVILSGFDPLRREIARIALERLVQDGRIHPGRIEEVVERARSDTERRIKEIGEQAAFDVGIHGLDERLIFLLGRLSYRIHGGQNILQHSKEVAWLAGMMAAELGLDQESAKRAGLLHDVGKAVEHEFDGKHTQLGADIARKCGESFVIVNAIEAHHQNGETRSPITVLVSAANTISLSRPGAQKEALEGYIRRLERLEALTKTFDAVEQAYAVQAGREIRVMANSSIVDDAQADQLATDIAEKIESEAEFPGQIKVIVIRETRAVEYAR
jgi:ribonuclease Y